MNKIKKQFKIQLFFVFVLSFCISGTVYSQIYDWTLFANDYANGANIISLNSPIIAGGNIGEFSGDKLSIDGNHNLIDGNGNSGFSFSGKRVSFENLIFKGFGSIVVHDDQYWGGALFADSGSNISFTGDLIEFSSNFATATDGASAGALFIGYTDGAQTIVNFQDVNVNFLGNIAKANGGAIHSYEDSSLSFSGTDKTVNFEKNTSVADNYRGGGAIYTIGGDNRQALIYFNDISSVNFIRNFSGKDGGAIFEGVYSNIEFNNSIIDFSFNTAQSSGGAIYIDNGSIMTISGLAKFTNNKAQTGGAIFIDNAQLNIIANKGDFLFENNQSDNGIDIYMKGVSKLSLNADNNNIIMKGGINGEKDSSIIKEGDGNWILSGSNKYEGSIDIQKGGFILYKAQSVQLSSLTIGAGAKFSMADDSIMSKIYAGNLTINGTYEVDLSLESLEADITSASYISIGNGAKIKIFSNLASSDLKAGNILLLYAQNGTTGSFNNLNYVYLGKGFGYSWIQDNNALYMSLTSGTVPNIPIPSDIDDSGRAVINALNNLDTYNEDLLFLKDYLYQSILAGTYDYDGQTITNQVSGKFMANILSLSLINKDYNSAIYSKINESKEVSNDISKAIWVQGIMSGSKYESAKEPSKFQNDSFGVQAGFNFLASRDFVAGAYAGYESNQAKQGDNKADINEIQLGLYGGYFDSWFNVRFLLAGTRQNFSVNRQISVDSYLIKTQSDFNTFNISAGIEAEFPIWLNSTFDL
ncbi:MAG: autotransporter domain-containing protein, partial [Elusimicrobiota bacterium]|nr:autotransporter domain-containing protein [Elusimicrobiota bacterium]